MPRKQTKARRGRGRKSNRRTRRNGRKMMKGGITFRGKTYNTGIGDTLYSAANVASNAVSSARDVASSALKSTRSAVASKLGLRKLTMGDFGKSFTAVRRPFGLAIYKLEFKKDANGTEEMFFDFSLADGKQAIFYARKTQIITGVNKLLLLAGQPELDPKTATFEDLKKLKFNVSDRNTIMGVKRLLTDSESEREQYFKIVEDGQTAEKAATESLSEDTGAGEEDGPVRLLRSNIGLNQEMVDTD